MAAGLVADRVFRLRETHVGGTDGAVDTEAAVFVTGAGADVVPDDVVVVCEGDPDVITDAVVAAGVAQLVVSIDDTDNVFVASDIVDGGVGGEVEMVTADFGTSKIYEGVLLLVVFRTTLSTISFTVSHTINCSLKTSSSSVGGIGRLSHGRNLSSREGVSKTS